MSRSPVLWLACRERWQSILVWVATLVLVGLVVSLLIASQVWEASFMLWVMWGYVGGALTLAFYLGTASQAGRFFVDARRSGLIELLLAAPLNGRDIVQGQWRASVRMFAAPVIIFLCVQLAATALSQQASWRVMATTAGAWPNLALTIVAAAGSAVVTAANLVTLCWFGMWMGMTSKSANLATLKTLVFVQVIPWFVVNFASGIVFSLLLFPRMLKAAGATTTAVVSLRMAWLPLLFTGLTVVLSLAKDIFFFGMARRKLYANFRDLAVRAVVPIHFAVPPSAPPSAGRPPVIGAKP
jgi:hypothetical protein